MVLAFSRTLVGCGGLFRFRSTPRASIYTGVVSRTVDDRSGHIILVVYVRVGLRVVVVCVVNIVVVYVSVPMFSVVASDRSKFQVVDIEIFRTVEGVQASHWKRREGDKW